MQSSDPAYEMHIQLASPSLLTEVCNWIHWETVLGSRPAFQSPYHLSAAFLQADANDGLRPTTVCPLLKYSPFLATLTAHTTSPINCVFCRELRRAERGQHEGCVRASSPTMLAELLNCSGDQMNALINDDNTG